MKRVIGLLLVLAICLSLCACGKPDIESCVFNANALVERHKPYLEGSYVFSGEYLEEDNAYVIIMCIDEAKIDEILQDADERFVDMIRSMAIENLDNDTETIAYELNALRDSVIRLFDGTDVTVVTGYVDFEGNVSNYG